MVWSLGDVVVMVCWCAGNGRWCGVDGLVVWW